MQMDNASFIWIAWTIVYDTIYVKSTVFLDDWPWTIVLSTLQSRGLKGSLLEASKAFENAERRK